MKLTGKKSYVFWYLVFKGARMIYLNYKKKKKKKKKTTPAVMFLELIFRDIFFILKFSKMYSR